MPPLPRAPARPDPRPVTRPAASRRRLRRLAALATLAIGLSGAGARAEAPPSGARPADPMAEVLRLIGDAACRTDADCRTLGVGHRPCGGPQRYLAWSAWRTSSHALGQAAAATRSPPRDDGDRLMSTCQVPVDPGARCAGAQPAGPGAPARPGTCQLRGDAPPAR